MKKRIVLSILLSCLSFQHFSSVVASASTLINPIKITSNYYINIERPRDKEKIENFWTIINEGFLTAQEKEQFTRLKIKVEDGKNLTVHEREILSELRSQVIGRKLGDARFDRYKKLIEKREKQEKGELEIELTKEEKREIYDFEKEIQGN